MSVLRVTPPTVVRVRVRHILMQCHVRSPQAADLQITTAAMGFAIAHRRRGRLAIASNDTGRLLAGFDVHYIYIQDYVRKWTIRIISTGLLSLLTPLLYSSGFAPVLAYAAASGCETVSIGVHQTSYRAAAPFCKSQMAFCAARMSLQCHCKASQARHRAPWHRHALHAYLIRKLTPCIQGRRSRGMRASFKCALSCPGTWHMHKRHSSRPLSWTRNPLAQAACVSVLWSRVEPAEGVLPTKLPCQMPTHFSIAALRRRLGAQLHACCSL